MKVGKMPYGAQSEAVEKAIVLDIMDTIRDWLSILMDNYKVCLLYCGVNFSCYYNIIGFTI
jgi:hypothetical protein